MKKFVSVCLLLATVLYCQADTIFDSLELTRTNMELALDNEQKEIGFDWFSISSILVVFSLISIMVFVYIVYKKRSVIYSISDDQLKNDETSKENWGNFFNKVSEQPEADRLYKKLIRLAHPDRFPNDKNKIRIANEITALLGESKLDLSELKILESRISEELLSNV